MKNPHAIIVSSINKSLSELEEISKKLADTIRQNNNFSAKDKEFSSEINQQIEILRKTCENTSQNTYEFMQHIINQLLCISFSVKYQFGKSAITKELLSNIKKLIKDLPATIKQLPSAPQPDNSSLKDLQNVFEISDTSLKNEERLFYQQQYLMADNKFQNLLQEIKSYAAKYQYFSKRIFISYAWPSPEDGLREEWMKEFVINLARDLIAAGLMVYVDQLQSGAGKELNGFMEKNIKKADHILVICNRTMMYKFQQGFTGVSFEYIQSIQQYKDNNKDRFIIPLCVNEKPNRPGLINQFAEVSVYKEGYLDALVELIRTMYGFGNNFYQSDIFKKLEKHRKSVKEKYPLLLEAPKFKQVVLSKATAITKSYRLPHELPNFVGRDELLTKLTSVFDFTNFPNAATLIVVALAGLGGVGKTSLAKKWMRLNYDQYDFIAWFDAESVESLKQQYYDLGILMNIIKDGVRMDIALAKINTLFENCGQKWLFIYDNAENFENIKSFMPTSGGHILITSRNTSWPQTVIKIGVLSPYEADILINKLLLQDDNNKYDKTKKLAEILGYLPLAISHACQYIKEKKITISEYCSYFDNIDEESKFFKEEHYPIYCTWKISADKIIVKKPKAFHILCVMAYLDATKISRSLLKTFLPENSFNYELPAILSELANLSLIENDYNSASIHRLLQEVIRLWIKNNEEVIKNIIFAHNQTTQINCYLLFIHHIVEKFKDIFWVSSTTEEERKARRELIPHLLRIAENLLNENFQFCDDNETNKILTFISRFFYDAAFYIHYTLPDVSSAIEFYKIAVKIRDSFPIDDDKANFSVCLGEAYRDAGRIDEAIKRLNIALEFKKTLGNKREIVRIRGYLAAAYRSAGNTVEAVTILSELLKTYYYKTGKDLRFMPRKPDQLEPNCYLLINTNASWQLFYSDENCKLDEIQLDEVTDLKAVLLKIPNHIPIENFSNQETITIEKLIIAYQAHIFYQRYWTLNQLGSTLSYLGKYNEAITLHRQALAIAKQDNFVHENRGWALLCLLNAHCNAKKDHNFEEAVVYAEQAIQFFISKYGKDHPDLGRAYLGLARVSCKTGNYSSAIKTLMQAREIFSQNNPNFECDMSAAAIHHCFADIISHKEGNKEVADDHYKKALDIYLNAVSVKNLILVTIYESYAEFLITTKNHSSAMEYFIRALKLIESKPDFDQTTKLYINARVHFCEETLSKNTIKPQETFHTNKQHKEKDSFIKNHQGSLQNLMTPKEVTNVPSMDPNSNEKNDQKNLIL